MKLAYKNAANGRRDRWSSKFRKLCDKGPRLWWQDVFSFSLKPFNLLFITEQHQEDIVKDIFSVCDTNQSGFVSVSKIIEFIAPYLHNNE